MPIQNRASIRSGVIPDEMKMRSRIVDRVDLDLYLRRPTSSIIYEIYLPDGTFVPIVYFMVIDYDARLADYNYIPFNEWHAIVLDSFRSDIIEESQPDWVKEGF